MPGLGRPLSMLGHAQKAQATAATGMLHVDPTTAARHQHRPCGTNIDRVCNGDPASYFTLGGPRSTLGSIESNGTGREDRKGNFRRQQDRANQASHQQRLPVERAKGQSGRPCASHVASAPAVFGLWMELLQTCSEASRFRHPRQLQAIEQPHQPQNIEEACAFHAWKQ